MLKMQIDPTMCMKTKDSMTKCLVKYRTFAAIDASFARESAFLAPDLHGITGKLRYFRRSWGGENAAGRRLPLCGRGRK
jgi:hypothetical protein